MSTAAELKAKINQNKARDAYYKAEIERMRAERAKNKEAMDDLKAQYKKAREEEKAAAQKAKEEAKKAKEEAKKAKANKKKGGQKKEEKKAEGETHRKENTGTNYTDVMKDLQENYGLRAGMTEKELTSIRRRYLMANHPDAFPNADEFTKRRQTALCQWANSIIDAFIKAAKRMAA